MYLRGAEYSRKAIYEQLVTTLNTNNWLQSLGAWGGWGGGDAKSKNNNFHTSL